MELIPVKERAYPPEIRMTERLLISTDVEDVLELPDERYESERPLCARLTPRSIPLCNVYFQLLGCIV
ncbi:DNA replication terminus site-binding protein [Trichinella pseudospiralis]